MPPLTSEYCRKDFPGWGDGILPREAHAGKPPLNQWRIAPPQRRHRCDDWSHRVRSEYREQQKVSAYGWPDVRREMPVDVALLRDEAERNRSEFQALAEQWHRDTRHSSLISQKIAHPAYLRIIGMGRPAIVLLLEELRDRPAHWFAALRAVTNLDPIPPGSNPLAAREAWLTWGRRQDYLD
jgi:hypothetical protein